MASPLAVSAYLQRLNYTGPLEPSAETLRALHVAHLRAVPFENYDIHLREPIVLDAARVFEKIVHRRRGGFCYELNGLFALLLRALGYDVTLYSARVWNSKTETFGPEFDHLVLNVAAADGIWLSDVGFGDSFETPLRWLANVEHAETRVTYRLTAGGDEWLLQNRAENQAWQPNYTFTTRAHAWSDFAERCAEYQTSPAVSFTQKLICSRATADGRITLSNRQLIVTQNGTRYEQELSDDAICLQTVREHFAFELPRWPDILHPPR